MLFCDEAGMKISLFPAHSRVIFRQNSDIFTKMIILFKLNDIGLKKQTPSDLNFAENLETLYVYSNTV